MIYMSRLIPLACNPHYDHSHDEAIDKVEAALFYDIIRMDQGKSRAVQKDELPRPRTGGGH